MSNEVADPALLQRRLHGSMKLVETTCTLGVQVDLDDILRTVTASVCDALLCERATLYLYDETANELHTRVATELEISEIRTSVNLGISGWVARRRKVANVPHPQADARWNSGVDRQTGFVTRNILAAPVISAHDSRLLGVLELLNRMEGDFDEFDERLVQAFALHAANALERARLLEQARESQALRLSADIGRTIQTSFLPQKLPEIPDYEVATWWQPAEAVSGDYYDVLKLPDGRLGVVIADVSGHGVGPSLIMASVRAMLRVITRTRSRPEEILAELERTIGPDLPEGRFITFLILALDPAKDEIEYANAGHGPALHLCRKSGRFEQLEPTSTPLGFPHNGAASRTITMKRGDLLLLGTDGAIELRNEQDEMFGRERLEATLYENRRLPAHDLMPILQRTISNFHPGDLPPDDVTLLLLERKLA